MNTEHWFTAAVAAIIIHLFSAYFGLAVLQQWRNQEPFHYGAYNVRLFESVQIPRPEKKAIKSPAAKTKKTVVKKKQIKKKVIKTKPAPKPAPKIKKAISTATKTKKVKEKKKQPPKENQEDILKNKIKQLKENMAFKEHFQKIASRVKDKQENTGSFDASSRLLSDKIIDQYKAAIFSRIQPHWTLPDFLTAHKNLNTEVLVVVDRTGRILSTSVQTSSGNRTFDDFATKAVADSNPLPEPPSVLGQGPFEIVLNFVPEGMEF